MIEDGIFSPNKITVNNLCELISDGELIDCRRECEISELVDAAVEYSLKMLSSEIGICEILSLISRGIFERALAPDGEELISETAEIAELTAKDKAVFARLYTERMRAVGVSVRETDFLAVNSGEESVTYVKNALADEAYDVFCQELRAPTVRYSSSLREAARAVSGGEVSYCLLPLEERGGARLSAVSELIYRNDLKIASITPVFGFEGTADMKYALLSLDFSVPEVSEDDDRYFEVRLDTEDARLSELLSAAAALGIDVYKINTLCFGGEEQAETCYELVLRGVGLDFTELLVYLTVFTEGYTPVGMYKNLE